MNGEIAKILGGLVGALILIFLSPGMLKTARAADVGVIALGLRGGISTADADDDFETYEAYLLHDLPWIWQYSEAWGLQSKRELTAGVIEGGSQTEIIAGIGPTFSLLGSGDLSLDAGVGVLVLGDDEIGDQDFGGLVQLTVHSGIGYRITRHVRLGYRFFHFSDAGIYGGRSLNRHLLELGYTF